jgi:hypothetical protein
MRLRGSFLKRTPKRVWTMKTTKLVIPLLAICIVVAGASPSNAGSKLGVGVFGGVNVPLLQDDAGSGNVWGVRASYELSSITLQPYAAFSAVGDYSVTSILGSSTFDGGDLTVFGLDATIGGGGTGFGVYLLAGVGSYKLAFDGGFPLEDTRIGFSTGLGFRLNMTNSPLAIDARMKAAVVPLDGGGSRKYFLPTVGVSYSFGKGN